MDIRKAGRKDIPLVTCLARQLWPNHTYEELLPEMQKAVLEPDSAVFLAWKDGKPVGFAQCSLRGDYVEGIDSSPAGFLEGILVEAEYSRQGIARALTDACQEWTREQGAEGFASDCELDNIESYHFHLAVGFREVNRIICFVRQE